MDKKQRVEAALQGLPVDRVPVSMWSRDYRREWSAQALVEATLESYSRYDWDYVRLTPRACYHAEGWKARYRPADDGATPPILESTPISRASDWKRLRPLEPDQGAFGEQLLALQLMNHSLGFEAYFVETLFNPLSVARYIAGSVENVLHTIHEDRTAMHTALRVITETLTSFAIACLEEGAHGIFYSTNGWANAPILSEDQYREFGEQYDLELLDAIKSRSKLTILHNCGPQMHFDLLAAYPVHAINWAIEREGNPDLLDGMRRSGKAVMGGLNTDLLRTSTSPQQIQENVAEILEKTGTQHLLLAPGCTLAPDTPTRNIEAVRRMLA
uniref:Uroporphyrinogen decarboxylase n=1 Tax=Thermosporothrix sp. COM3 TaxID=2490863 RepID=A0A455SWY4_9CHLR|nr:uroporphyrinogen decarboxylase [Thermosporothrix sp. COM3]